MGGWGRERWGGEGLGRVGRVELSGKRWWDMEGGGGWVVWRSELVGGGIIGVLGAGTGVGMEDGAVWERLVLHHPYPP